MNSFLSYNITNGYSHFFFLTLVQVKSMVRVTQSQTLFGLIFLVEVAVENEESFGEKAKHKIPVLEK